MDYRYNTSTGKAENRGSAASSRQINHSSKVLPQQKETTKIEVQQQHPVKSTTAAKYYRSTG